MTMDPIPTTAGLVVALALTLDQHHLGFLQDFEQNAARIDDLMRNREGDPSLQNAGYLARQVLAEDANEGRRRGER